MAEAGVGSRRDCEAMIEAGRVEVNGVPVGTLPLFVNPEEDRIVVDGRPLRRPEKHLYVLLNKPPRTITAVRDEPEADRRTVVDLVDHPAKARLFPVGRLDFETVGLLLLTNDGELANRLTHPRHGVPKTYKAVVAGELTHEGALDLVKGIMLTDRRDGETTGASRTNPAEVRVLRSERGRTTVEITLREGRNRQVRRMLAAVGCDVKKLERTAMGPLTLRGVPRGGWRELTAREVSALRRAANAGPDANINKRKRTTPEFVEPEAAREREGSPARGGRRGAKPTARGGRAGPRVGPGRAGPGRAGPGRAGPGRAGPGLAGAGRAGPGLARPGGAGPGRGGPARGAATQPRSRPPGGAKRGPGSARTGGSGSGGSAGAGGRGGRGGPRKGRA